MKNSNINGEDLSCVISNGVLESYQGEGGKVVLPNSIVEIGENAFIKFASPFSEELNEVVMQEGVISIRDNAFYECRRLKKIIIPSTVVSIGAEAFAFCESLEKIYIPKGVKKIDEFAFAGCEELEEIVVEEGNDIYYSEGNCLIEKETKTLLVGCKNSIIPESVEIIGCFSFENCSPKSGTFVIPNSVKKIEKGAFSKSHSFFDKEPVQSIVVPKNVELIEAGAFSTGGLKELVVADGNKVYYSLNNCIIEKKTQTLIAGSNTSIIPDCVKKLGSFSFARCSLEKINIPDSIEEVGYDVFCSCYPERNEYKDGCYLGNETNPYLFFHEVINCSSKKKTFTIHNKCKIIGSNAFKGGDNLRKVIIPPSVVFIEPSAYFTCSDDVVFVVEKNSYAERFCKEHECEYELLENKKTKEV